MEITESESEVVRSQIKILKEFQTELEDLLTKIIQTINHAKDWIDGKNNQETYYQITIFLIMETSNYIGKCHSIAKKRQSLCHSPQEEKGECFPEISLFGFKESKDYRAIIERIEHVNGCATSLQETLKHNEANYLSLSKNAEKHSKKIKNIELKYKNLEKEIETTSKILQEKEIKSETKLDEIMQEFHRANNFMSELQKKIDVLSDNVNEHENKTNLHSSLLETLHQDMQSKFSVQNEQVQNIEENSENANEINFGINNEIKESKDFILKMKTDRETLKDEVNKMEENVNKYQKMVDPLKKDFLDLTSLVTRLEESTETLRQTQTDKSTELQNKIITIETMLNNTSSQAQTIFQTVNQLQSKTQNTGFNIQVYEDVVIDLKQNEILKCFNHVIQNLGGNYDKTTGIFTAPVDGLYLFGLFITNKNETDITICFTVKYLSGNEGIKSHVFCSSKNSSGSVVVPLSLSKSEQVYLRSAGQYSKLNLTNNSFYVGVLISEC